MITQKKAAPAAEAPCLKVCETCPWLRKNHGREHPAGWYKPANLRRLWNALRRGDAGGIVCHSSDPDQKDYGGTALIKPTVERRACAGAILALGKHIEELNACGSKDDIKAYQARHKLPLTRAGIAVWFEACVMGRVPAVEDRRDEIGLPWEKS